MADDLLAEVTALAAKARSGPWMAWPEDPEYDDADDSFYVGADVVMGSRGPSSWSPIAESAPRDTAALLARLPEVVEGWTAAEARLVEVTAENERLRAELAEMTHIAQWNKDEADKHHRVSQAHWAERDALSAQLDELRAKHDLLMERIGAAIQLLEECVDHEDVIEALWPARAALDAGKQDRP